MVAGVRLAALGRAPGLAWLPEIGDDGSLSLLLFEIGAPEGSWAACDYEPGDTTFEVTQYGARRLWDEAAAAFTWWDDHGRPRPERFGLVVSPHGQQLFLAIPISSSPRQRSTELNATTS